ncbi:MAG: ABC transporter ATP-binding protein [Candidatus Methanomethylophilaceae archaeon]|nr:ABC transporter ATP-binding protein [Candidatus Methanomethylophilaceae archaeon]
MTGGPIEIVGLRKQFKDFVAVNDLTLSVKKNSFTGFLGPNGAGKSTTLKILTNLIRASSGSAYLNGIDITEDPKNALRGVGTVVETPEFYSYLTPKQTFRYMGGLFGMTRESIDSQADEILEERAAQKPFVGEGQAAQEGLFQFFLALFSAPGVVTRPRLPVLRGVFGNFFLLADLLLNDALTGKRLDLARVAVVHPPGLFGPFLLLEHPFLGFFRPVHGAADFRQFVAQRRLKPVPDRLVGNQRRRRGAVHFFPFDFLLGQRRFEGLEEKAVSRFELVHV